MRPLRGCVSTGRLWYFYRYEVNDKGPVLGKSQVMTLDTQDPTVIAETVYCMVLQQWSAAAEMYEKIWIKEVEKLSDDSVQGSVELEAAKLSLQRAQNRSKHAREMLGSARKANTNEEAENVLISLKKTFESDDYYDFVPPKEMFLVPDE